MSLRRDPIFAAALAALLYCTPVSAIAVAQEESPAPTETDPGSEDKAPDDAELPPTALAAGALLAIIASVDEEANIAVNGANFTIDETQVTLVFDLSADRMRLVTPIVPSDSLSEATLKRLMQANFDTALDARYAIAQGQVWSTFIHPLTSLSQEDFISGIAQTVTLARTYGTTYTSGAMSFGGGDSQSELQRLLDRLRDETDI